MGYIQYIVGAVAIYVLLTFVAMATDVGTAGFKPTTVIASSGPGTPHRSEVFVPCGSRYGHAGAVGEALRVDFNGDRQQGQQVRVASGTTGCQVGETFATVFLVEPLEKVVTPNSTQLISPDVWAFDRAGRLNAHEFNLLFIGVTLPLPDFASWAHNIVKILSWDYCNLCQPVLRDSTYRSRCSLHYQEDEHGHEPKGIDTS